MARPLRIEYAGAWYHVSNRGFGRQILFQDRTAYQLFLDLLSDAHNRYQIQIHAYCLLDNHYHLLIHTPLPNLGRAMRHIDGLYTIRHNRLTKKTGPLFRGRYKAILVEPENYLLPLSRYIHLNPVVANLVQQAEEYPWSSYRFFLNKEPKSSWLYNDKILNYFEFNPRDSYRKFVMEGLDDEIKFFYRGLRQLPILGTDDFIKQIKDKTKLPAFYVQDVPEYGSLVRRFMPSIEEVIKITATSFEVHPHTIVKNVGKKYGNIPRKIAIYLCCQLTGQSQKQIAREFNIISSSAISQMYRRVDDALKDDPVLLEKVNAIKEAFAHVDRL